MSRADLEAVIWRAGCREITGSAVATALAHRRAVKRMHLQQAQQHEGGAS